MKDNPNHGNRLRPTAEAYEVKKKRSRDRYATIQLKNNPYWLHNKILRDLANLYGLNTVSSVTPSIGTISVISTSASSEKFLLKIIVIGGAICLVYYLANNYNKSYKREDSNKRF